MKIPLQAFAEAYAKDLPLGTILQYRGTWALLVGYEDGQRKDLLMLAGKDAGRLLKVGVGMAKCLAIVSPFSWFPAVESDVEPVSVEHQTTTLAITAEGPVIIGGDVEDYDTDYRAFRMNGQCVRDFALSGLRFDRWSAELALEIEPYKSLGQMFSVKGHAPSH